MARTGTQFEKAATRLRGGEHRQEGSDLGLRHHIERQGCCFSHDVSDAQRLAIELCLVHVLSCVRLTSKRSKP
jgi:hypothetical protein